MTTIGSKGPADCARAAPASATWVVLLTVSTVSVRKFASSQGSTYLYVQSFWTGTRVKPARIVGTAPRAGNEGVCTFALVFRPAARDEVGASVLVRGRLRVRSNLDLAGPEELPSPPSLCGTENTQSAALRPRAVQRQHLSLPITQRTPTLLQGVQPDPMA